MAAGALSGLPGDTAILSGGGLRLTRPTSNTNRSVRSPAKRGAGGGSSRMAASALSGLPGDAAILPGGGLRLTRPT